MTRQITPAGLALIKASEGCRLEAYRDIGGVLTIGYGSTKDVSVGQVITQEVADQRLLDDLMLTENGVSAACLVPLNDNQFSAVVSFAYNEGLGTLHDSPMLKLIDQGDMVAASAQFPLYNKVRIGGKLTVSRGLTIRRHNEQALFLTPVEQSAPLVIPTAPQDQTSVQAVAPRLSFWQRLKAWFA